MWLCDVCVSLQHNKGCQASGFLFASLLCYHSPVSPNFLSHRMQITRPLFREVFGFFCVFFLFLFCGKLHKGACILTAVSYSTLLCNRSKAVGDTVTCLFCSNQGRSVNTATLVLHSLKTKTTCLTRTLKWWHIPPPVWILIHFQRIHVRLCLVLSPFI